MKRVIAGVLAAGLLLGAAGAGWWFLWRLPSHPSPAEFLPADTVAYFEIPDGAKTLLRYRGSKLRQIVEHPDFQGVGAALSGAADLSPDPAKASHWNAAAAAFGRALGGTSFLAVTRAAWTPQPGQAFDPAALGKAAGVVAGFYGSPNGGAYVEELSRELAASFE